MKNLDRNVTLLCPLCGNDQFLSLDEEFEDLLHAGDDARVRCSDCGSEYTKRELLDSNAAIIDNAVDELAQDAVKELEKELKKAMIAGISLLVAIISLFKSSKAQRLQNKVNELELKIKQDELDKITKEKEDAELACVEARFITVGKGKHRLKVWNSGNATAYHVSARFDGDVGIMIMDREKQPFEELEAGKSYELILITHNGFASKFRIITEWTDSSGKQHTKTQMGDFS